MVIHASQRIGRVVVVGVPRLLISRAAQPDVGAGEDLPDRADHVPRDQQRQGHDHQRGRGCGSRSPASPAPGAMPERDLDREHGQAEDSWRSSASCSRSSPSTCTNQSVPTQTRSCGPKMSWNGVVDHGHQRHDRAERDQHEHRQDQEPGSVVVGLVHASPVTRSAGRRHRAASAPARKLRWAVSPGTSRVLVELGLERVRPEPRGHQLVVAQDPRPGRPWPAAWFASAPVLDA